MSDEVKTFLAIRKDRTVRRAMHYYLATPYEDHGKSRSHLFNGTRCWCKPTLRGNWDMMQTQDSVYIYIEHEGAHGPTTDST